MAKFTYDALSEAGYAFAFPPFRVRCIDRALIPFRRKTANPSRKHSRANVVGGSFLCSASSQACRYSSAVQLIANLCVSLFSSGMRCIVTPLDSISAVLN